MSTAYGASASLSKTEAPAYGNQWGHTNGTKSKCAYSQVTASKSTAKKLNQLNIPYKVILNAARCAEMPVTTRSTRQSMCRCPKFVPERAATSPN
eukprot:6173236-Pleurochrysis_carterae.AAC.4